MKKIFALLLSAVLLTGCSTGGKINDPDWVSPEETVATTAGETAASSENYTVTKGMMTYYFHSIYSRYYDNAVFYRIIPDAPLKSQSPVHEENTTWFDKLMLEARDYVSELLALCEAGNAEGITLTKQELKVIDNVMNTIKEEAALIEEAASLDEALTMTYGSDITAADLRAALELKALADKYTAQYGSDIDFNDQYINTYYEEHREEFDSVDVLRYVISANHCGYKAGDEASVSLDEAMATAEAWANKLAGASSDDEYRALIKEFILTVRGKDERFADDEVRYALNEGALIDNYLIGEEGMTWAFSAETGDSKIFADESSMSYTVLRVSRSVYRDESPTRNLRQIFFDFDAYETEGETQRASEEVYAKWETKNFSKDALIDLCKKHNQDEASLKTDGLLENLPEHYMLTSIDKWLFAEERVAGDHLLTESVNGWHILYYEGESTVPAWQSVVKENVLTKGYDEILEKYRPLTRFDLEVLNSINA